ncbi:Cyclin-dependent kinase [Bertholletia excelsa]
MSKPPEKKRKISPIVWGRDDGDVSNPSKNRMVQQVAPLGSLLSLLQSFGADVAVDGDTTKNPLINTQLQGMQIAPVKSLVASNLGVNSKSPVYSSSLLLPEETRRNYEELEEVEDSECGKVWHISASRWAYDEESPGRKYLENSGEISSGKCSHHVDLLNTPESGEFRREGSQCSQGKSSSSIREDIFIEPAGKVCHLEREVNKDDFMELDEMRDGTSVSYLDSDFDYEFQELAAPKPRSVNMLQGCRSVFEYEKLTKINEGTYGVVYKARDKKTDEIVALKKVKMGLESDGFPMSALREINLLLSLHHPSIVNVKEVVMDDRDDGCGDVFMVMEYMEHDIKGLIGAMKQPFSEKEVKGLMLQLLEGVKYLHDNWIMHRDLKTSNLLLNNSGKLKICDFGLSRQYGSPARPFTPLVVTLWYRAPELLLGTKQYSTAVDMWSIGCIMAELLAKQPLFNGKTEFEQLDKIFCILGSPNETIWPGFSELPGAKVKFAKQLRNTLREKFPAVSFKGSPVLSDQGFDLLSQLLTYDPEKRITAEAALRHGWFHATN